MVMCICVRGMNVLLSGVWLWLLHLSPLSSFFFCSSKIVGSLTFVFFSFLFFQGDGELLVNHFWWTLLMNVHSGWPKYLMIMTFLERQWCLIKLKISKDSYVGSILLCMALDRTLYGWKWMRVATFQIFNEKLQDFELERTCLSFHYIMRVNKQKFKWSYHVISSKGNEYSHKK